MGYKTYLAAARLELWDDGDRHVEELIAVVSDFTTAQTTYADHI